MDTREAYTSLKITAPKPDYNRLPIQINGKTVWYVQEQCATAAAEAKYLPVIEKLVGKITEARADLNQGSTIAADFALMEALALAAPLLRGK